MTGGTVPVGTSLRYEVKVRNQSPVSRTVRVKFQSDRSQSSPYDFDQTSSSQSVSSGGGTKTFTFNHTPSTEGTYYRTFEVETSVNSSYTKTDDWPWGSAISVSAQPKGNLNVTVKNQNGSSISGATVKRYNSGWVYIDSKTTNSSGVASWSNIDATDYKLEAYYGGEYWVNGTASVPSGGTDSVTLQRNEPYAYDFRVYDGTTDVTGGTVPVGTSLRYEVKVRNQSPVSRTVRVKFQSDRSQSSPYDFDQTSSSQSVSSGGGTKTFTFNHTPSTEGTYYRTFEVETSVNSSYTKTDDWPWGMNYALSSDGNGSLKVIISPQDTINAGAKWRVDGGTWQESGTTLSELTPGQYLVEFKTISAWDRPGNILANIVLGETTQTSGTYKKADIITGSLKGNVAGVDNQNNPIGPLSAAQVEINGYGTIQTGSNGDYLFSSLSPATYLVTVSKEGYYSSSREIDLTAGETEVEHFKLTKQLIGLEPISFDFKSPNGKAFVPGMPGEISFETSVNWNGSPGSVRFKVAEQWYTATTADLGGGQAKAVLKVPVPSVFNNCSKLMIEITNGEGGVNRIEEEVFFYPLSSAIPWYDDIFNWTDSGTSLSYSSEQLSWKWDLPVSSNNIKLDASLGFSHKLKYYLWSGTLTGSIDGYGDLNFSIPHYNPEVSILGKGTIGIGGKLSVALMGCETPVIVPSWNLRGSGKAGVKAPVVLIADAISPGVGSKLASIPLINDIKLALYVSLGGELIGIYKEGQNDCFLGSSSNTGNLTGGLEAQALFEALTENYGIYIGGDGVFVFELCPDLSFKAFKGEAFIGAYAESLLFKRKDIELASDFYWEPNNGTSNVVSLSEIEAQKSGTGGNGWHSNQYATGTTGVAVLNDSKTDNTATVWQPIGKSPLKWGEPNRLSGTNSLRLMSTSKSEPIAEGVEEKIVENVTWAAHPSVYSSDSMSIIWYSLHDTNKPWYASSDIAEVFKKGDSLWEMNRITDDSDSEFNPEIVGLSSGDLMGTWTRVDGDISDAESPEEVLPYLEIVVSFYDQSAGFWGEPFMLTDNDIIDRDPLPVVFGDNKGIVWVQNQGDTVPGTADEGDDLFYIGWDGTKWKAPEKLWSAKNGIIDFSFTRDKQGQGHIVFTVDEDGDPETKSDRELHLVSTQNNIWQASQQLTDNDIQDSLPVLLSPNNDPMLVWSSGGILKYTYIEDFNPIDVYAQKSLAEELPTLKGVTMAGGAAIAYSAQSSEGMDILAAFYDAGVDQWSFPRQLTNDEHAESSLSLSFDGSSLILAYLKTQTLREDVKIDQYLLKNVPQPGQTDLYVLQYNLGYDLGLNSGAVTFDPFSPPPGKTADIKVKVENYGDLTSQNVEVAVYDGNPDAGGTQIGVETIDEIIAGDTAEAIISWNVPSDLNAHNIFAVVDPELKFEDKNRSNNTTSTWSVLPDLSVENIQYDQLAETQTALTAKILNTGSIPSGLFKVSWHQSAEDGKQIGIQEVKSIKPGGYSAITFLWDQSGETFNNDSVKIYTVIDSLNNVMEVDESNNIHFQLMPIAESLIDSDSDGLLDDLEKNTCTDPDNPDTDQDGIIDGAEDTDHDGLHDEGETDPCKADTDGDGINDGIDIFPNINTEWSDNDKDGIGDNSDEDDDNDGMPDIWEEANGLDPFKNNAAQDADGDGITNLDEYQNGTDPQAPENGNRRPEKPLLLSPHNGWAEASLTAVLKTDQFADPDSEDTHGSTLWQVSEILNFSDPCLKINSKKALTNITIPHSLLDGGSTYYWRAKFYDNHGQGSEWSEVFSFTTKSTNNDLNKNGIPDDQELSGSSDLDGNGVSDNQQDNLKCINSIKGEMQFGIKFNVKNQDIEILQSVDDVELSNKSGKPDIIPNGLISFRFLVENPGDEVEVNIYLSEAASKDADWYKYDPNNGWQNYTNMGYANFSKNRKQITLKLKDGSYGDHDGSENSIIIDPSGLGINEQSDDGGGCFISTLE